MLLIFVLPQRTNSFNPLFIRSVFLLKNGCMPSVSGGKFQSLIHQVSVSFSVAFRWKVFSWESFNPLFIRSVFLFMRVACPPAIPYSGFNPLFIRSVFLLKEAVFEFVQFRDLFQSLIHQVSVSFLFAFSIAYSELAYSFNPLFIRSVFLFSVRRCAGGDNFVQVSIPYSSGQCFF